MAVGLVLAPVTASSQEWAGSVPRSDSVAVLMAAFRGYEPLDDHPVRLAEAFSCRWIGVDSCARATPSEAEAARARALLPEVADSLGLVTSSGDPFDRPPCPWGDTEQEADAGMTAGLSPPRFAGDSAQVAVSRRCWQQAGDRFPRGYASGATVRLRRSEGGWEVAEVMNHWVT